jgi:enediyne biosynthesis protein E11
VSELENVVSALTADGDDVDGLVAGLTPGDWTLPSPAPGWTIGHQIAHLTAVFHLATTAAADPEGFKVMTAGIGDDFSGAVDAALARYLELPPDQLLGRWRTQRAEASAALAAVPPEQILPWLVNPLPPAVLAGAGIMELFGHGQDIADALGVRRERTDRIVHLVGFVAATKDFGYLARRMTPPEEEFRFEVTAPSGKVCTFGPADAGQQISGPAEDLCLLATRRRHRDDLALTASGQLAEQWLDIAQAYRGPAGEGRQPGQFAPALR